MPTSMLPDGPTPLLLGFRRGIVPKLCMERIVAPLQRLIDLYTAWDKPDQAAKWQQTLADHQAASISATPPAKSDPTEAAAKP